MQTNNISPCILFVDDEENARKYFEKAFKKEFHVLTAESVAQAKEVLNQSNEDICVLVTDQKMPDANGVELLDFTRDNYPHIVRVLTTGYSDLDDAISAVNKGEILRYIQKPWNLEAFDAELKSALRYYYLQNERDQLLQEKLSIRQKMTDVNRVRDLIVWSSGTTYLNNATDAIKSILLQAPVSTRPHLDNKDLDLWSALEQDIREMLDLSRAVNEKVSCDNVNKFEQLSLGNLKKGLFGDQQIAIKSELPSQIDNEDVLLHRELFRVAFTAIKDLYQNHNGPGLDRITLRAETNPESVSILFHPAENSAALETDLKIDSDLLAVFLICAHHKGITLINKKLPRYIEMRIPLAGKNLIESKISDHWIDQILSRYEADIL